MSRVPRKLAIAVFGLVGINQAFACSCAMNNPDKAFEQAAGVVVAAPMEAAVVAAHNENHQGTIRAKLTILDVLKGPAPNPELAMEAAVDPQGPACQAPISLGTAYVIFLYEEGQQIVPSITCGPTGPYQQMRSRLEEACTPEHPYYEKSCAPNLLEALRRASTTITKYHLDDEWQAQFDEYVQRRIEQLNNKRTEPDY